MLWFSPVPPARTDIAQYSARIIPHLAQLTGVSLLRPDDMAASDLLPSADRLASAPMGAMTLRTLNASRACLYNIGNNPVFHSQILGIGMMHPGIIILHDRSLQDLCHAALRGDGGHSDPDPYERAMMRWYGRKGREAGRAALAGDVPLSALGKDFPLFEVALQGALGVVTHNPDIADEITERFPAMPVKVLHLPYDGTAPADRGPSMPQANEPIRLAMFGYMGANRRLCQFLKVWAQSVWRDRFTLDLAGEIHNRAEVQAVTVDTGLGPRIRDHGYLPDGELDALIGRSHLVLNLRNPTMGEASGSQLRIWANGAASVVSETGWYGALPEGAALRIDIHREAEELTALLADLAEGRIDLAWIAKQGKQSLAASDPANYAAALMQWLDEDAERMSTCWTETALIEAVARTYALSVPPRFMPKRPDRLLS